MPMMHTLLNQESPEVTRYFQHLEYLSALLEKDGHEYRPILNGERYLTEAELSRLLKVTQRTLIEHRNNGKLPYYKFGGRILRYYRKTGWEPSRLIKSTDFIILIFYD